MSAITLNGLRVVAMRISSPWNGVPTVDVDLDPEVVQTSPTSGPATIVIGATPPVVTLIGTIDSLASGSFIATSKVRVQGGAGGWRKNVPAQHFNNPAGLTTTTVLGATSALVGEALVELEPGPLGRSDYFRTAGRASRVLDGAAWWVDLVTGVTTIGPRPPAVPDPSLEIMSWDPLTKTAELTCDTLIVPGTVLVDTRIGESPVTVRSVEQTFDAQGSRATAWCSVNPVDRLQTVLTAIVRELAKVQELRVYRYRVVGPAAGDTTGALWALQAVDRDPTTQVASPAPDLVPAAIWPVSGVLPKLAPGLEVLVALVDGTPVIVGCSTLALPLQITVDAQTLVAIGTTAAAVAIAGAGAPVGRVGDQVQVTIDATAAAGLQAGGNTCSLVGPDVTLTGIITKGSKKVTSG